MSQTDIKYYMQLLADLHNKFKIKEYNLTSLDQHAAINIVEQLYAKLVTTEVENSNIAPKIIPQPRILQESPSQTPVSLTTDELNKEIEEVFQVATEQKKYYL